MGNISQHSGSQFNPNTKRIISRASIYKKALRNSHPRVPFSQHSRRNWGGVEGSEEKCKLVLLGGALELTNT